jgi:hypothetical protein
MRKECEDVSCKVWLLRTVASTRVAVTAITNIALIMSARTHDVGVKCEASMTNTQLRFSRMEFSKDSRRSCTRGEDLDRI